MATVPIYNGPQVRQQALEGGFQRAPDVGSDLQRAGQALTAVADVVDRIDLRDAQTKANDIDQKVGSEWMKWDAQNRNNFRGEKVDGYAPAAQEWWKKAAETYGKDLDPRAAALARESVNRKMSTAMGNVAQFTGQEKERHSVDTFQAKLTTDIQFGVTTGNVGGIAAQIRADVANFGAQRGWTTEQVQAEQLKNLSALHLAQITKLASTDATKAQEYYQANKAEVGAAQQPRVEEVLKGEGDNQFAQQFAAQNANKPLAEQLAEAGKITDPARREKVIKEVKLNHAAVREARAEQERQASDQAWQLVGQGKRVPEAILAQMDGKGRVQLQEHLQARAERLSKGTTVKTDMATYIDLRERMAKGEKVNLVAYTEKIAQPQMEQLLDIQTASSKGGSKQDSMITDEGRISSALVGLGIDKKKDPDTAAMFTMEVDRRVRAASAAKGDKPLTPDEKQAIVDRVAMDKVYVDEWGTDPEKPVSMLKPEELSKAYVRVQGRNVPVSTVPATDRRQIIQALQATGQRVSEQAIVEMYLQATSKRSSQGRIQ